MKANVALILAVFCFNSFSSYGQSAQSDSVKYDLIWHDEFDGAAINPLLWNFETGNLGVNNEMQSYQEANAAVRDGYLVITAKKERKDGQSYTSARLNTLGKFAIPKGRIEARIKCPLGKGLWPGFWMLGDDIEDVNWPKCGEIDIMEHVNADSLVYSTVHWDNNGHAMYGVKAVTTPGDFHLYAVEWDDNEIRWYVDKVKIGTVSIAGNVNNTGAFHKPFYILLNMAVGGDFPGKNTPIDQTKIPAEMLVDYVRVYQMY